MQKNIKKMAKYFKKIKKSCKVLQQICWTLFPTLMILGDKIGCGS